DGDEQAERGGDEGFSDAAGNRGKPAGVLRGDAFERADDAHDRSEKPDERGRGADGGETGKPALHLGVDNGYGTFEATFGRFNDFFVSHLRGGRLKFRKPGSDNLGDVALLIALGDGN